MNKPVLNNCSLMSAGVGPLVALVTPFSRGVSSFYLSLDLDLLRPYELVGFDCLPPEWVNKAIYIYYSRGLALKFTGIQFAKFFYGRGLDLIFVY